ncbi:ADP-ribosylglycohydrolase family protein [Quatrionicoccus australiensis]|uniref:ADP-ribosylglycohydrolase family protein n=1 Tax=Quatrionicoccus australiensis TaxID=138118 RepID=UPI001CFB1D49|nr:ADP-ribosylglycohydrolase family protein [Quatrionicoccus australiensis]
MGAFIGDALALDPHWYDDPDQLHADYDQWISDYTTPKPGRYHAGMKAGQLSQSGILLRLTLQSLVNSGNLQAPQAGQPETPTAGQLRFQGSMPTGSRRIDFSLRRRG